MAHSLLSTQSRCSAQTIFMEEKQFTKSEVLKLCERAVIDAGYGSCAAILIVRFLRKIIEREAKQRDDLVS
jgi:hypothetical protein